MTDKTSDTVRVNKPGLCAYCGGLLGIDCHSRSWCRHTGTHKRLVYSILAAIHTLDAVPEPTPEMEEMAREILIKCNKRRASFGVQYV